MSSAEAEERFEKVLATTNAAEIALIKSMLESIGLREGQTYYFTGEYLSQWSVLMGPAVLMVRQDQCEAVREALKNIGK